MTVFDLVRNAILAGFGVQEKVKDFIKQAWEKVKAFNEQLGERGSFGRPTASSGPGPTAGGASGWTCRPAASRRPRRW